MNEKALHDPVGSQRDDAADKALLFAFLTVHAAGMEKDTRCDRTNVRED